MSKKVVYLVVALVVLIGGRFVLERVASNWLSTAELLVSQERYEAAERKLDSIDKLLSWTDAGDRTEEVRQSISKKREADRRQAEALRQQHALEEAQAQWREQQAAEGGEQPKGVYHGLNKAEKLKR